jgi:hypothetical protein
MIFCADIRQFAATQKKHVPLNHVNQTNPRRVIRCGTFVPQKLNQLI